MIFFEIIDGILCDRLWYRYLWGGTWYHVRTVIYDEVEVTGWIRAHPEPHEEVITTKDFGMKINSIFGTGYFDKEEKPEKGEKPQELNEGDRDSIEKGEKIRQKALEQEQQETLAGGSSQ